MKLNHTSNIKCNTCERTFDEQWKLENHLREDHEKEKTFDCDVCDESFCQAQPQLQLQLWLRLALISISPHHPHPHPLVRKSRECNFLGQHHLQLQLKLWLRFALIFISPPAHLTEKVSSPSVQYKS